MNTFMDNQQPSTANHSVRSVGHNGLWTTVCVVYVLLAYCMDQWATVCTVRILGTMWFVHRVFN